MSAPMVLLAIAIAWAGYIALDIASKWQAVEFYRINHICETRK